MSRDANHGPLWSIGLKSLVFTVLTVTATAILATTIRNSSAGEQQTYTAVFSDATSLNRGDDVRMVGVKVGTVSDVGLTDNRLAKVKFTIRKGVRLDAGSVIQIRFRNLVGQRYLAVEQPDLTQSGAASGAAGAGIRPAAAVRQVRAGHTFGLEETRPALDLTLLFNGFRPLLRMLNPKDVNELSKQIVAVFQGEDATVDGLLSSTASLTSTLASKDQVIGELITSLSGVMTTVNERSGQLDTTIVTMQQLVSGLAEDRAAIGESIAGMGTLTSRVGTLFEDTRPALRKSINDLGALSGNLDAHSDEVESFLQKLPVKLDRIGRTASYGSWLNFYLCSMDGRIPMVEGYMGDIGVQPVAGEVPLMSRFPTAFAERNRVLLAVVGLLVMAGAFYAVLNISSLPVLGDGKTYQAVFAEGGGLRAGDEVRVAGVRVGEVTDVRLDGKKVVVSFQAKGVHLKDATTAAIKVKTMLGQKFVSLDPVGQGDLHGAIPLARTTTPYDVNAAVSDFSDTLGDIDQAQLEASFNALSAAFKDTPASVQKMVGGLTDLSRTISSRDDQLADLLKASEGVTGTLSSRNAELAKLLDDGSDLLGELQQRRDSVHALLSGTANLGAQLHGLVQDNDKTLAPALAKLDRVTAVLNRNQAHLDEALAKLGPYYRVLGAATGNGRWVDAYLCGLFDQDGAPILQSDALRNCYPPGGAQ